MRFASLKTRIAVDVECIHSCIHPCIHACTHASIHALLITSRARCNGNRVDATDRVGNRIESNHLSPPPPPSSSTSFARRPLSLRSPRLSAYAVPLATTTTLHAYPCQRPYARMACLQSAGSECSEDDDDDDDMRRDARERCRSATGRTTRSHAGWIHFKHACMHFMHSSPVRDDGE